ncbi:MAG TPA: ATP-binding protein [Anaerolineae bacterium]|nr:ATP-binding protein [Anaerolineae bacterium]HQI84229.1 ATP-binding protein [Anaerolineae bacterium]
MTGLLFAEILIADTVTSSTLEMRTVLQNVGYIVRRVASGQAVLDEMRQSAPDLILLATTLPDMDGYTVTRQLRSNRRAAFVPIIMLADENRQDDIAAAVNAGADEVLVKPVSNAELLLRVRAMLRLKQTSDALTELNATLEQKVVERTQALEEAHARLRHAEKLAALGNLAASVAHDINNPLTGILTYLYLMKQSVPVESEIHKDLELIERQAQVIAQLVKQLQSFSRPPRKDKRLVGLGAVLGDILALIEHDLRKRDIKVSCECACNLPDVLAASDQLSEVFMNLIVNARDAMPSGGALKIRADVDTDNTVLVRVSDSGPGIAPEIMAHLFEPFHTTKGENGTGLGLAICYRIVEEHKGEIWAESQPGQGTTFLVRLPVAQQTGVE